MKKLTKEQLEEFIYIADGIHEQFPEWRKGQAYFCVLDEMYPELGKYVKAKDFDPFHNDVILPDFLQEITEH